MQEVAVTLEDVYLAIRFHNQAMQEPSLHPLSAECSFARHAASTAS